MKILFILDHAAPKASANGNIVLKLAKAFQARGDEVFFICNRPVGTPTEEVIDGIHYSRNRAFFPLRILQWLGEQPAGGNALLKKVCVLLNRMKMLLFTGLYPLTSPWKAWKAYRMACRIHSRHNLDCVIGVNLPFDAVISAYLFKRKYPKIPCIAYILDNLSCGMHSKRIADSYHKKKCLNWEFKIFPPFDKVLFLDTAEPYYKDKRFFDLQKNFYFVDIPLLYDLPSQLVPLSVLPKGAVNIVYTGQMGANRNPGYFLRMLTELGMDSSICFHFFGSTSYQPDFERANQAVGKQLIINHGYVDTQIALSALLEADFLLNLEQKNSYAGSSKVLEYISARKPILSFHEAENGTSNLYLSQYPEALIFINHEHDDIQEDIQRMRSFIQQRHPPIAIDTLGKMLYRNTPEEFIEIVTELVL